MNEMRNELLNLLHYIKSPEDIKQIRLEMLLDRFEYDIKDQLNDIEHKKRELEDNLETLQYVRKELGIK